MFNMDDHDVADDLEDIIRSEEYHKVYDIPKMYVPKNKKLVEALYRKCIACRKRTPKSHMIVDVGRWYCPACHKAKEIRIHNLEIRIKKGIRDDDGDPVFDHRNGDIVDKYGKPLTWLLAKFRIDYLDMHFDADEMRRMQDPNY